MKIQFYRWLKSMFKNSFYPQRFCGGTGVLDVLFDQPETPYREAAGGRFLMS